MGPRHCIGWNSNICVIFLQSAWEEVEQSLMELAQTRSRIQLLQTQLHARKKEAQLELIGGESQTEALSQ